MESAAPHDLKPWLENLVWFFGFVLICIKIAKEFRGGENKREVTLTDDCVCKKDFEKFAERNQEEHDHMHSRIGGMERGIEAKFMARLESMATQDKASREKMHGEISDLRERSSASDAKIDLINQRAILMDNKLDRLIEKKSERSF